MTTRTNGQTRLAGIGGHHSPKSTTVEWLTPPGVIERLGGPASFDLDPCAPVEQPYPTASAVYTKIDNGLIRPWRGRVWLNPPYDADVIGQWLARMADHGRGVALIFARTETQAFQRHVWLGASGLLFIAGRINFHVGEPFDDDLTGRVYQPGERAPRNSGAPLVLCAYGAAEADRLRELVADPDGAGDVPDWPAGRIPGVFVNLTTNLRHAREESRQAELFG